VAELGALVANDAYFAWIDPHAARLALAPWRRPRLDVHGDPFLVSATVARPDPRTRAGHGVEPSFHDLAARLERLLERRTAARDAVNGAFDIHVSHVAHRTNQVMKPATVVSTVVVPVTVILGIFGSWFGGPPVSIFRPAGFVARLVAIVATTTTILLAFRRRGWLEPRRSTNPSTRPLPRVLPPIRPIPRRNDEEPGVRLPAPCQGISLGHPGCFERRAAWGWRAPRVLTP